MRILIPDSATRFWAHAAVFGALWGAVEATVGSFLHLLQIPLCGVVLAAGQAAFLVAVRQLVPLRGLLLAVSGVASLVTSLAPSGAMIAPLVAIFVQGALIELCFLILPGVLIPAVLGGMLCTLWAVAQMIAKQVLLFGFQTLEVYESVLRAAGRATGLSMTGQVIALAVPLGALAVLGAAGGAWGVSLGRRARGRLPGRGGA